MLVQHRLFPVMQDKYPVAPGHRSVIPRRGEFNLGLNDGPAAGPTMPQFYFHVLARHTSGVPDPGGGIRWVIPAKARYWQRVASFRG